MVVFIASVFAAFVCTFFYTTIIYLVDRYEKEPLWLLAATFLWGAVPSVIVAFIVNTGLSIPFYLLGETAGNLTGAAAIAPLVEESLKGAALLGILLLWRHEIDSHLDGIIYAAMVGMGFAMVENVFYFISVYNEAGWGAWGVNVFLRAILLGLNHALFTSMTGLGIATSRLTKEPLLRYAAPIFGWGLAVFLHAVHNFSATVGGGMIILLLLADFGGVMVTLAIIIWAVWQEGRWIEHYLQEEVRAGALTITQYQRACTAWGRIGDDLSLLFSRGLGSYWRSIQFYEKCAELAYKKRHFELFRHQEDLERINLLRQEVAVMSRQHAT